MYCKHCGNQISDDSTFCQYCGGKLVDDTNISENKHLDPIQNININGNLNLSNGDSLLIQILKFCSKYKTICIAYVIWFILNLILLICGSDKDGFFPRIFKEYHWWHEYTLPTTRAGYEKYSWSIEWKIKYYGWTEFIVYIALLPLVIYVIYILIKKYKTQNSNKHLLFNPSEGLRR